MDEIVDTAQLGVQFEADIRHCGRIAFQHISGLDALRRHIEIEVSDTFHNF